MWFLICNLETETYSEKTDMLFDPLHLSLVLHPSNSPSTLSLPAESTHDHTRLSKSCVCAHHGLWRCFHYLTAVHCNVIYSIRFFSKHGTPLAKTTLNLRLNGLRGYQNVWIIFITPTQLSLWHYISFRKYNCLKNTECNFKPRGKTDNTMIWSKAMFLLSTKSNLRLTMSWLH